MDQSITEVEEFEVEQEVSQQVTFEVIENDLLILNKPTVQLYGN